LCNGMNVTACSARRPSGTAEEALERHREFCLQMMKDLEEVLKFYDKEDN
jgi:hypothetical protein